MSAELDRAPRRTARVRILGEGEYEVPVASDKPVSLGDMLDSLGISERGGTLYLDGRPATPADPVLPQSEAFVLPRIRGG